MPTFKPAFGLTNRHLQSILSSTGPRKLLEKRRARSLLSGAETHIITTEQGVKLQGYLTKSRAASKGLAIILHGWEGSADSLYVLSSGQKLLEDGFDVFRLNFRDHGDTQHLNKSLFNSTLLEEVVQTVGQLCTRFGGDHNVLCGYSLGGNFCLRVANVAKGRGLHLHQAIAICPLLHPPTTMKCLNGGFPIYEKYFVKKWKRSLQKKLQHHDHLDYGQRLAQLSTLDEMNDFFVLGYTHFDTTNDYFEAYSLLGDALQTLAIPSSIITSLDDPIIPPRQVKQLFRSKWLCIDIQRHGGHCAFIKNWKFESWASDRISALVAEQLMAKRTASCQ